MRKTGRGHYQPSPSAPLDEPLDDVSLRLAHLLTLGQPRRLHGLTARLGIGAHAGADPVTQRRAAELAGVSLPTLRELLAGYVEAARHAGPPPSLPAATALITTLLPATPAQCALALFDAGLTSGVLHPAAVLTLSHTWGAPSPAWHRDTLTPASTLYVDARWPEQHALLTALTTDIRRAGVLHLTAAIATLTQLLPHHPPQAIAELLTERRLHTPGSTLVWDHTLGATSRLLTVITRTLTALGPTPADTLAAGLHRAGADHHGYRLTATADQLSAFAREHPALTHHPDGLIALTRPVRPSARDQAITAYLDLRGGQTPTRLLLEHLMTKELFPTPDAALAFLHTTPYLRNIGYKTIGYPTAQRPDAPAAASPAPATVAQVQIPEPVHRRVRALCMALPETTVRVDEPRTPGKSTAYSYDIRRRSFCLLLAREEPTGPQPMIVVRADATRRQALLSSDGPYFASRAGSDRLGLLLAEDTDWEEVAELVTQSYRRLAPRKLTALLD